MINIFMNNETQIIKQPFGYIYRITSKITNKSYIGQTIRDPSIRFIEYKYLHCKQQPKIYNALKKYGPDSFIYEIFDNSATNQEELDFLESSYILCFDSIENGYNIKDGGLGGSHSKESILKQALKLKGRKQSKEHIQKRFESRNKHYKISENTKHKISVANKGRIISENTRIKISKSLKGKKQSAEHIAKRTKNCKKHIMSNEQKQKLSILYKGVKLSETTKRKMSEAHKGSNNPNFGKHLSNQTKEKISITHKGKILSEEHKNKISESMKQKWCDIHSLNIEKQNGEYAIL